MKIGHILFCLGIIFLGSTDLNKSHADSLLNDMMPSVFGARDRGPKPEETLIAPFAEGDRDQTSPNVSTVIPDITEKLVSQISVSLPHQDNAYMTKWAEDVVSRVMTHNPGADRDDKIRNGVLNNSFLPSGLPGGQAIFETPYFNDRLRTQKMRVQSFVETPASIQNQGDFGGIYRWLIDVPIMMTFYPQDDGEYKTMNKKAVYETKKVVVRIQIARVLSPGFTDGCAIESFTFVGASF